MSQPTDRTVRVTIYNQPYTLMVSDDPGEVEELANSVDELMTNIASRAGNVDSGRVAVLACLHLADKLRAAERKLDDLSSSVEEKSRQFTMLLDEAMK